MKNPLDSDSQKSGLLLGSDPLEDVRNRRASAQSDDGPEEVMRYFATSRAAFARPSNAALSRSEISARRALRPYQRAILNARSTCS